MSIKHERINSSDINPFLEDFTVLMCHPLLNRYVFPLCSRSQCVAYSILNALIVVCINITHSTHYYTHSSMATHVLRKTFALGPGIFQYKITAFCNFVGLNLYSLKVMQFFTTQLNNLAHCFSLKGK